MTLGEVLPESFPNWERPLNLIQLILAEEMEQLKRSGLYSDRDEAFLFDMERKMKISINGEERETDKTTVALLLEDLGILPGRVAVEVNLKIIRKADYLTQGIKEGDSVEIVNFVGGG
jgi:thiamine biosynthesis protein ThiS